jgi:mevalonate kinase
MNQDEVLATLHRVVAENMNYTTWTVSTPHLVALVREVIEQEREEIAQMIENIDAWNMDDPASTAVKAIRARGSHD